MHDPKQIPIPLEVARATMTYLGSQPYNKVVALIEAFGGAVVAWERHERERVAGQSIQAPTGAGSVSIDGRTGSVSPTGVQVHTDGASRPMSNGISGA